MSTRELDTFVKVTIDSDLYGGGHVGKLSPPHGSGGTLETLSVFCCSDHEVVVLVTTGNPTFERDGPRLRLLRQLKAWLAELKKTADQKAPASPAK